MKEWIVHLAVLAVLVAVTVTSCESRDDAVFRADQWAARRSVQGHEWVWTGYGYAHDPDCEMRDFARVLRDSIGR